MIMSWLIELMIPNISDNFVLYATTAEIWSDAKKNVFQKG